MPNDDCLIMSRHTGLIEMMVDLGQPDWQSALLARIHDIERTGGDPVDCHAPRAGILLGRRHADLTRSGDTLCALGVDASCS